MRYSTGALEFIAVSFTFERNEKRVPESIFASPFLNGFDCLFQATFLPFQYAIESLIILLFVDYK